MTVQEALETLALLKPHAYPPQVLLKELHALDGRMLQELWAGREGAPPSLPAYTPETAAATGLLAEEPYDLMYLHYLMARVSLWNGETERYNQHAALFEEAYAAYRAWVTRSAAWSGRQHIRM